MPSIINARCCQKLQNSLDDLTLSIGNTKSYRVAEALDNFHEIAKQRIVQGLRNCEDLSKITVPLYVVNLTVEERVELETILAVSGGWIPRCGDRWLIIFTPEHGVADINKCRTTYLVKTGRLCGRCDTPTEYRDADERCVCPSCDRWVSCYPGSDVPMGSVATSIERRARIKTHSIVDALWQSKYMSRKEVYIELSQVLNLPRPYTHIAMIEVDKFPVIESWAKARLKQLEAKN